MPVSLTVLGRSYSFKTLREIRWVSSLNCPVGVLARSRSFKYAVGVLA